MLLAEVLHANGFTRVETAEDGIDALEKMQVSAPRLILLDLMMPRMDGFEFCGKVREDENFRDIPIIVQTAAENAEMRARALRGGASDLINKPINAEEMVARVSIHLERTQLLGELNRYRKRMTDELRRAQMMQLEIMPAAPEIEKLEELHKLGIANHVEMSSELGGDFWKLHPINNHQLAVVMCDFSGHGISAALNTFRLHTLLRDTLNVVHEPDEVLEVVNRKLYDLLPRDQFATFFMGVIDTQKKRVFYACAGCPNPIVLRKNKSYAPEIISGRGMLVGAVEDSTYELQSMPFEPGDVLLTYSDALIETKNDVGQCLDEEAIAAKMQSHALNIETLGGQMKDVLLKSVLDMLWNHSGAPLEDDLTLALFVNQAA